MTCQNQAGYGIFSEDHSWVMIKFKYAKFIFLGQHTISKNYYLSVREKR